MKTLTLITRSLLGILLIFASVVVLFDLIEKPELTGNSKVFMEGMEASIYLFPLIKITELVCGVALLSGFFVPLAATILAPISINILLYHSFVDPTGLPVAIFMFSANIIIALSHWGKYKAILRTK